MLNEQNRELFKKQLFLNSPLWRFAAVRRRKGDWVRILALTVSLLKILNAIPPAGMLVVRH